MQLFIFICFLIIIFDYVLARVSERAIVSVAGLTQYRLAYSLIGEEFPGVSYLFKKLLRNSSQHSTRQQKPR